MSVLPRVIYKRRETITALPLYYAGHLLKKNKQEKEFKKFYGELRGSTLFLYKDSTQDTYTERLDLEELKFIDLDSQKKKTETTFTLRMHKEEVQLKIDNPDTAEEWRGYILTVHKKEIPSKLRLLPGQMIQLTDILTQEKKRNQPLQYPPLPPRPSFLFPTSPSSPLPKDEPNSNPDVPECFFRVTRQEAEQMLEANPEYGGLILRPSRLPNNYAVTLRQVNPRGPVMKNYRVSSTSSGFVIELKEPVTVSSLNDVLQFFIKMTEYRVHPYASSQPYDTSIDLSPALKTIGIASPVPKTIPKAHVTPIPQTKVKPLPPTPELEEGDYVVPCDDNVMSDDPNLKLAQLDGELQKVFKLRREQQQCN